MDAIKDEAALELSAAMDGIGGGKVKWAGVPGASRTSLSRAKNGCESNPLYRVAGVFVLFKRLGMSRKRAQRIIDWLQEVVDWLWPEEEEGELTEVLDEEQALDGLDDAPQLKAVRGCVESMRQMRDVKKLQRAHDAIVIRVLDREIRIAEG